MTTLPERWPPGPGDRPPVDDPRGPGSLWADGSFRLRVTDPPGATPREWLIDRPFGLVGRLAGADLRIDDRAVGARHLYLHLDGRGLFAVDLATRTGTRFDGRDRPAGWLRPGQTLEVAGRRIELLECRLRHAETDAETDDPPAADLLADAGAAPLARVTLYPARPGSGSPRTLGSELVFLGRGACCGVRVETAAARTHCVLVRGPRAAYVVDLAGRDTLLNGQPLQGAGRLDDGDPLTVGTAQFEVRIRPAGAPGEGLAVRSGPRVEVLPPALAGYATGPEALPADTQGALLAWMMGQLHAQQGESMRRQAEFQHALTGLIRQMQEDQATMLSTHLERTEAIQQELVALREELDRRLADPAAAAAAATAPPLPRATPLNIDAAPRPTDPDASTSWLIGRINQLEEESRSSWRDLLGRITGAPPRRAPS
jgi:pSer/pThr/pTyr-binding forkhead associated (FHA) protein